MTSDPEGAEPLDRIESRLKRALHFQQDSDELSLQDKADLDAIRERLRSAGAQQESPNGAPVAWMEVSPMLTRTFFFGPTPPEPKRDHRQVPLYVRSNTGAQPASEERERKIMACASDLVVDGSWFTAETPSDLADRLAGILRRHFA